MPEQLDSASTRNAFLSLQERICGKLLELDPICKETEEEWDREEGGGGITRAFSKGDAMEKEGLISLMFKVRNSLLQQLRTARN